MVDLRTPQEAFGTARANVAAVIANSIFTQSYAPTNTHVTFASGTAVITCALSYANGLQTARDYSWDGGGIYMKPTGAPKGGSATAMETFIAVCDGSTTDDSVRMTFNINTAPATPTIQCVLYNVDNTYTDVAGHTPETYVVGSTHTWLGYSYDATKVRWWRSANGTSWTQMHEYDRPAWVLKNTLTFQMSTNRVAGSNTNALLDNFNVNGTTPAAPAGGGSAGNHGSGFMLLMGA